MFRSVRELTVTSKAWGSYWSMRLQSGAWTARPKIHTETRRVQTACSFDRRSAAGSGLALRRQGTRPGESTPDDCFVAKQSRGADAPTDCYLANANARGNAPRRSKRSRSRARTPHSRKGSVGQVPTICSFADDLPARRRAPRRILLHEMRTDATRGLRRQTNVASCG